MLSGGDQNVSSAGFTKVEGFTDPDDYVDIESGMAGHGQHFCVCVPMSVFSHWLFGVSSVRKMQAKPQSVVVVMCGQSFHFKA